MLDVLSNIPEVSFIDNLSIEDIKDKMIQDYTSKYKELTGEEVKIGAADPVRLIIYACAMQICQAMQYIDRSGKQDLLKYSYGSFLDNLAALKGVERLQPTYAFCTIRFTISSIRDDVVSIPEGTRVVGDDGIYFETTEYAYVKAGETFVDVTARCTETGIKGNGIKEGRINTLVDIIAYISDIRNTDVTSGGSDIETDESLAERAYLAPGQYSVAGPNDVYEYWIRTFNANITDIKVTSLEAGYVDIVFLVGKDKALPTTAMANELYEYLSKSNIRPLTDNVRVHMADEVEYDIDFKYYIGSNDFKRATAIQNNVNKAVDDYIKWQRSVGKDINPDNLTKLVIEAGAKRVVITSPQFTAVDAIKVAKLRNKTVTYMGIEEE